MQDLDIKNYFYHGIVDWLNYNKESSRDAFCLDKLDSILKCRYIYRPCDFKKNGITHNDCANPYTYLSLVTLTAYMHQDLKKKLKKIMVIWLLLSIQNLVFF